MCSKKRTVTGWRARGSSVERRGGGGGGREGGNAAAGGDGGGTAAGIVWAASRLLHPAAAEIREVVLDASSCARKHQTFALPPVSLECRVGRSGGACREKKTERNFSVRKRHYAFDPVPAYRRRRMF